MVQKLKPLNMGFDEALTRFAKVPKIKKQVVKEKQAGAVKTPRPAVKKTG